MRLKSIHLLLWAAVKVKRDQEGVRMRSPLCSSVSLVGGILFLLRCVGSETIRMQPGLVGVESLQSGQGESSLLASPTPRSGPTIRRIHQNSTHHFSDSCRTAVRDGRVSVAGHVGRVSITTFYGDFSVDSDFVNRTIYYGPLIIRFGSCKILQMGSKVCAKGEGLEIGFGSSCDPRDSPIYITLCVLQLWFLLLLIVVARYVWIRCHWAPKGFRLVGSVGRLHNFVQTYEGTPVSTLFSKRTAKEIEEELSQRRSEGKTIRFRGRMLIHSLLLFHVKIHNVVGELHSFKGVAGELDSLAFGHVSLAVQKSRVVIPLIQDYSTSRWYTVPNFDYFCQQSGCNSNGLCTSYKPTGDWVSERIWLRPSREQEVDNQKHWRRDQDEESWVFRRYCYSSAFSCKFTEGCWKGDLRYVFPRFENHTVYSLGGEQEVIEILVQTSETDVGVDAKFTSHPPLTRHSIIKTPNLGYWLCPFPSNKGFSVSGQLGDFQYNQEGSYMFGRDTAICYQDEIYGPKCEVSESFIDRMSIFCTALPSRINSFNFWVEHGYLVYSKPDNLKITLTADVPLNLSHNTSGCSIISKKVYGVRGDFNTLTIVYQTHPAVQGPSLVMLLPCVNVSVQLSCSSTEHYYPISADEECLSTLLDYQQHILDDSHVSILKSSHVNTYEPSHPIPSLWSTLTFNPFHNLLTYLSGSGLLVLLLLFILILRR